MQRRRAGAVAAVAASAVLACGDDVGPADLDEASSRESAADGFVVDLAVQGGFAGVDYALRVDGRTGRIDATRCERHCDWQPGQLLARVDLHDRAELGRRFQEAGFLDLARTEYGVQCCDAREYTLTYRSGGRQNTVHGDDFTLRWDLLELIDIVEFLVRSAAGTFTIDLAVQGGFAGVDYALRVDGRTGRIEATRCVSGCDRLPGQLLTRIDLRDRVELGRRFHEAGFLGLAETEYGSSCCDAFEYTLAYRAFGLKNTVHGGDFTLPADLLELIDMVLLLTVS